MAQNRGKQFERAIYDALTKLSGASFDRLPDPQAGYLGQRNICDYFGYSYPNAFYFECKSTNTNVLARQNITDNQWNGLINKCYIPGVIAGYFIWFIPADITIFVGADDLENYFDRSGRKSINVDRLDDVPHVVVTGRKKRILCEYDMFETLKNIKNLKEW